MLLKSAVYNEIACCCNEKISKKRQNCYKNIATWEVLEFTASDEGISTEG